MTEISKPCMLRACSLWVRVPPRPPIYDQGHSTISLKQVDGKWQMQELLDLADGLRITGSGIGPDGTIYVAQGSAGYGGKVDPYQEERGAVWKIVPADKVPAGAVTAPLAKK